GPVRSSRAWNKFEAGSVSTLSHRPRDGSVLSSSLHCMNDPQPEGHMASHIGRRKFLATLIGGAVAWPLAARAQQRTAQTYAAQLAAFRRGLNEAGFIEGRDVAIEYRWAEDQYGSLR